MGNLSHSIVESDLTDQLLQFGELESVAFQPGRSYAFINFKEEEEAIAAMKTLQGFPLAGNPLRIEFAKAVSLVPHFFVCYLPFFRFLVSFISVYGIGCVCVYFYEVNSIHCFEGIIAAQFARQEQNKKERRKTLSLIT